VKIAIVADVHGNLTALKAVIADIREIGADVVINAGDLVGSGARPAEVVDLVESLNWPGVIGNTDEVLWRPEPLRAIADRLPKLKPTWDAVFADVERTRDALGPRRIEWLYGLQHTWSDGDLAVVHASPATTWNAPSPDDADDEFVRTYAELGSTLVVFGHLHVPFERRIGDLIVANAGSVGLPYDGDPRASYLIVEDGRPRSRRVAYDIDAEIRAVETHCIPNAAWIAAMLVSGTYLAALP
jgi:putative phosphoesterase